MPSLMIALTFDEHANVFEGDLGLFGLDLNLVLERGQIIWIGAVDPNDENGFRASEYVVHE